MNRPQPSDNVGLTGAADQSAFKLPGGIEVTQANLEAEVLVRSKQVPVVALVWSPRSETSVQLGIALAELADADGGKWSFATVNVAEDRRAAQMFGVQGVPAVVAVAAGDPVSNFQGPRPPDQLRQWIDSLLDATAAKLEGGSGAAERVDSGPA
jgi:putative thioredoxin